MFLDKALVEEFAQFMKVRYGVNFHLHRRHDEYGRCMLRERLVLLRDNVEFSSTGADTVEVFCSSKELLGEIWKDWTAYLFSISKEIENDGKTSAVDKPPE